MIRQFRFQPGLLTERTAQQLNEIQRWIERYESQRRGDSELATVERIRVKLTAQNGATPPVYSGTEQSFTIAGAPEDKPNGRSFSPSARPIYERNGKTVDAAALAAGYHCWIDRRILVDGQPYYEFDIGETPSTDMIDIAGRTGSVADVTALNIDRGVVGGTPGAATFTHDDASLSLPGDVNTTTQTFAGAKGTNSTLGSYNGELSVATQYINMHYGLNGAAGNQPTITAVKSATLIALLYDPVGDRIILSNEGISTTPKFAVYDGPAGSIKNGGSGTINGLVFVGGFWISGSITSAGLTVGTSTITGGTSDNFIYENAGVVGEYTAAAADAALGAAAGSIADGVYP